MEEYDIHDIFDDEEIEEYYRHYLGDRNSWNESGKLVDFIEEGEL